MLDNEDNSHSFFKKLIDELVEFGQYDEELAQGLKWLDQQGQKEGKTIYEMIEKVLVIHDVDTKAKEWLRDR